MSKDTFYFSHDYNARNDIKIKKLISKHKYLGYGIYWAIVEELYNNANALPLDYECISFDFNIDIDTLKSIINDFDLFIIDNGFFGSLSIQRRLDQRNEKSLKARESAFKRWNKNKEDANALQTQNECNAIKESKVNKKESKEDISLSLESDFNIFWDCYNKKVDLDKCRKKFNKLSEKEKSKILEVVEIYVKSTPDKKFRKNPLTWLNGSCWNDSIVITSNNKEVINPDNERIVVFNTNVNGTVRKLPESKFLQEQENYKEGGYIYKVLKYE